VLGKGHKVRSSADARDQHVILGAEPKNADNAVDNMVGQLVISRTEGRRSRGYSYGLI